MPNDARTASSMSSTRTPPQAVMAAASVEGGRATPRRGTVVWPLVIQRLAREWFAGCVAACVTLAGWLTVSLLAYAPLGSSAVQSGIAAACTAVAAGGLVVALLRSSALPSAGLGSATVLIFAGAVADLVADPQVAARGLPAIAALAGSSVVAMGVLQWLFAALRIGRLAAFVPHPVLAGFMNGVAVLMAAGQLGHLWLRRGEAGAAGPSLEALGPLLLGLSTAAVAWTVARRLPRAPGVLIGLMVGGLSFVGLHGLWPSLWLGSVTGGLPATLPGFAGGWPFGGVDAGIVAAFIRHAPQLGLTALLMAIVGSLDTVLTAIAVDRAVFERHDPNRALFAFGCANVVSGLLGGLPLVFWRARALAVRAAGGHGRGAFIACAVGTAALYAFGRPLIEHVPLAVLSGLMLVVAWGTIDAWSRRLLVQAARGDRTPQVWQNLALVAAVCTLTVWRGLLTGVAVGVALSLVLFIRAMNRSLVRARYSAAERPSRRLYPPAQEAVLRPLRAGILVLEIEGALFFGNADQLAQEAERLGEGVRYVVLDIRRIVTIDASAAVGLTHTAARLARVGRRLLLAGGTGAHGSSDVLRGFGVPFRSEGGVTAFDDNVAAADDAITAFDDADQAVEWAERAQLQAAGGGLADAAVALDDCALFDSLSDVQRDRLRSSLQRRTLATGELLFREGDVADGLYVLTEGSMSMSSGRMAQRRGRQRFLSFSAGLIFGETAFLDGGGRSADAVADTPSVVYALTSDALAGLARDDPALVLQVMTNIARHLSQRLRQATTAWQFAAA